LKVAFDEHVPTAIAKAFIAFVKERAVQRISKGLIWETAADYAPKQSDNDYRRRSDVPWLDRFAAAQGHAVISGDVKMRRRPHEKLALYQHGFVVIFFEHQWSEWNFFKKSALMLWWREEIATKIKTADKGTFWIVPCSWPAKDGQLRNASLGLAKLLKDAPARTAGKRTVRNRPPKKPKRGDDTRQAAFLDSLNGAAQ